MSDRMMSRKKTATPTSTSSTHSFTPQLTATSQAPTQTALISHNLSNLTLSRPQAKLTVSQPDDPYEQQADRVAAQVMSMLVPAQPVQREMAPEEKQAEVQTKPLTSTTLVQSELMPQAKEEVQRLPQIAAANSSLGTISSLESRLSSSKGGGTPLTNEVRSFMEPRFGFNFKDVRTHTGTEAVQMNRELGAQAFTHGNHVYFGASKAPAQDDLTAHELTHVVQQTGGVQMKLTAGQVEDTDHQEGNYAVDQLRSTAGTASNQTLQCALIDEEELYTLAEPAPEETYNYTPAEPAPEEASYTPDDANMSTPEGTEVQVDAPPQQTDTGTTTDVGSRVDTGAGGASGAEREAHEGGAEGGPSAHTTPQEPSHEESWWDRGIDWVENKVASGVHELADKADGIPVLEQAADAGAWMAEQGSQYAGGLLKGAGTMVGGIANMVAHPVDTVMGLEAMAEHIPVMGAPLKMMHGVYDVAVNEKDPLEVANHVLNPIQSLQDDFEFGKKMVGGITKPYQQAIEQGKYAEALGQGVFDIGSIVLSAGAGAGVEGTTAAGRGTAIAGEVADAARIAEGAAVASDATRAAEVATVATDAARAAEGAAVVSDAARAAEGSTVASDAARVSSEVGDAAKVVSEVDDAARVTSEIDDATKVASEVNGAASSATANFTEEEINRLLQSLDEGSYSTGPYGQLPAANQPGVSEGLKEIHPIRFDESKPIAYHENMDFQGIKGAPSGRDVEYRYHSANKNAPEGSYSHENPTVQVNAGKYYRLPNGTWKKLSQMTEEERAAAHYH